MSINATTQCTGNHFKCTGSTGRLHRSVVFGQTFRLNDRHIEFNNNIPISGNAKNIGVCCTMLRMLRLWRSLHIRYRNIRNITEVWSNRNVLMKYLPCLLSINIDSRFSANIGKWNTLITSLETDERWSIVTKRKVGSNSWYMISVVTVVQLL